MSDETKRFDPLGEDNEIDELIRSTREEIERMDRLYAGQPVTPEPEAPKQEQKNGDAKTGTAPPPGTCALCPQRASAGRG